MSERFKDFDAAKDALANEAIVAKINGKEYKFPPYLSAKVVLNQLTWINEDGSLAASDLPMWFKTVFGEENFEEISSDVDFQTLQDVSAWLMEQYGLNQTDIVNDQTDGEDEGDTPK
jgi:hypothetical protein|tara:strand:- start:2193 stop:2543 length:351 start_codon:yes stop_codon:yes gene_type:complete